MVEHAVGIAANQCELKLLLVECDSWLLCMRGGVHLLPWATNTCAAGTKYSVLFYPVMSLCCAHANGIRQTKRSTV